MGSGSYNSIDDNAGKIFTGICCGATFACLAVCAIIIMIISGSVYYAQESDIISASYGGQQNCTVQTIGPVSGGSYKLSFSYFPNTWTQNVDIKQIDPTTLAPGKSIFCWSTNFASSNTPAVVVQLFDHTSLSVGLLTCGLLFLCLGVLGSCCACVYLCIKGASAR
jgi:hypothetical protein